MEQVRRLKCPVCRARLRGTPTCSRCGADLGPLMAAVARAYRARQIAREALCVCDVEHAAESAAAAQTLHATDAGRRLAQVCAAMGVVSGR